MLVIQRSLLALELNRFCVVFLNQQHQPFYDLFFRRYASLRVRGYVVWDKNRMGLGYGVRTRHELIGIHEKGRPAYPQQAVPSVIHDLPIRELRTLQTDITALLAQREVQARRDFKRDFLDRMNELDLTLEDLKPEKPRKERRRRDLPVRYRDPENLENTWTGVGKPKRWLQERLDQGTR